MENMNKDDLNLWIGSQIRRERMRLRITQESLAETIGVSRNHISMLETGRKATRIETIYHIACAFNISLSELFLANEHASAQELISHVFCDCSDSEANALTEIIRVVKTQIVTLSR